MLTLKWHKRKDDTARVYRSDVDLMPPPVLLLLRSRLRPRLELSDARVLSTDPDGDRLSGVEVNAHGPNANFETYNLTWSDLLLLIVSIEGELGAGARKGEVSILNDIDRLAVTELKC
jgi:hypothetical protein